MKPFSFFPVHIYKQPIVLTTLKLEIMKDLKRNNQNETENVVDALLEKFITLAKSEEQED